MIKKIFFLITLCMLLLCPTLVHAEKFIQFAFEISKDNQVVDKDLKIISSNSPIIHKRGDLEIIFYDSNNQSVWNDMYELKFMMLSNPGQVAQTSIVKDRVPYSYDLYSYELKYKGKSIFRDNLGFCNNDLICDAFESPATCRDCESQGSGMCGDGVCNNFENANSCPSDCLTGIANKYCDAVKDGKCDPDCKKGQDPDCPSKSSSFKEYDEEDSGSGIGGGFIFSTILIIALIIGAIVAFLFIFKKSETQTNVDKEDKKIYENLRREMKELKEKSPQSKSNK